MEWHNCRWNLFVCVCGYACVTISFWFEFCCVITLSLFFTSSHFYQNSVRHSNDTNCCLFQCSSIFLFLWYYSCLSVLSSVLDRKDKTELFEYTWSMNRLNWKSVHAATLKRKKTISISCYQFESNTFALELSMVVCCCYCGLPVRLEYTQSNMHAHTQI